MELEPEMVMALREMFKANADPKVRELIELREKAEHDEASRIQQALKTGREQGFKEGFEIGRTEGLEIGRKEGFEIGRKEGFEIGEKKLHLANSIQI